jgi:hypothetical protein
LKIAPPAKSPTSRKNAKINVLVSRIPSRPRANFALWDCGDPQRRRKALTYIDPCEEGEENIPKFENDKIKVPSVL